MAAASAAGGGLAHAAAQQSAVGVPFQQLNRNLVLITYSIMPCGTGRCCGCVRVTVTVTPMSPLVPPGAIVVFFENWIPATLSEVFSPTTPLEASTTSSTFLGVSDMLLFYFTVCWLNGNHFFEFSSSHTFSAELNAAAAAAAASKKERVKRAHN